MVETYVNPHQSAVGLFEHSPPEAGDPRVAAPGSPYRDTIADWAEMLFVDHGVIRLAYLNLHRLGPSAWRSAQPAPLQIASLARAGVRNIVNLRGPRRCGSYRLEQQACNRHGIRLINYKMRSRAAPSREDILNTRDLFRNLDGPVLFHCKTGADRVGLMSAVYLIAVEGVPVEQARQQLALRFGHIKHADTGILDFFFERYLVANSVRPIDFFVWVETAYDANEIRQAFVASRWANVLTNRILRRE